MLSSCCSMCTRPAATRAPSPTKAPGYITTLPAKLELLLHGPACITRPVEVELSLRHLACQLTSGRTGTPG
eukprot:6637165-Pyramimonas_sp.AAC.1